ncbi:MAG: AmmeMemoRadiSam system protein B [Candidatus Omnitrophota bacterium]
MILNFYFLSQKPIRLLLTLSYLLFFCGFCLILCPGCLAQNKLEIKLPNVQGVFYPADKAELGQMIDGFLNSASDNKIKAHIYGLISPHAGYVYSGPVAAQNYQAIKNSGYKTIIILAASHYFTLASAAVYSQGVFQTPLGAVPIDQDFAQGLIKNYKNLFARNPDVFEKEHAIEVQIPFLQQTLKDFKIVPIIIPQTSYGLTRSLAQALTQAIGKREDVLIIASSDMSHYHQQETAYKMDQQTLALILNSQPEQLFNCVSLGKNELCGSAAVVTLLQVMKNLQADNIQLLKYATSADSAYVENPDKNRVVGYASIIFTKKPDSNQGSKIMLNSSQKKELLTVARKSIVNMVKHKQKNIVLSEDQVLLEHRGAFVTIYKNKSLRGCIGLIESDQPLINVVNAMAIQAATRDPRFVPISIDELDKISLEISVMSPIQQITDINQIEVGKHGLIIRQGFNSGLLLPQVATEYNWDREQFLAQTCNKAGLNPDAWKQGAKIFIFSAEVFNEQE